MVSYIRWGRSARVARVFVPLMGLCVAVMPFVTEAAQRWK